MQIPSYKTNASYVDLSDCYKIKHSLSCIHNQHIILEYNG